MDRSAHPAIPARHSRLGEELVYRLLVRPDVWSHFDGVWLRVVGPLPHPADGPLIAYLNHPSWWDGYMAFLISREVLRRRFRSYLMMDERQLRSYRFFAWCGCFSVDRRTPRAARRSLLYASRALAARRASALWIFPQGEIAPNDRRPIAVYSGAARVAARAGGAALCPVALRYEFRGEQRPDAFIRLGPVHRAPDPPDPRALTTDIARRLTAAADALRDEVCAGDLADYRPLLRGRPGVNRLFDALRGRLPGRAAPR